MLRIGKWRVGWLGFEGDPISTHLKVLARNANDYIIMVMVDLTANIPSGTAGYSVGCLLLDSQAGVIYSNQGSVTSCSFVAATGVQGTAGTDGATGPTGPTGSPFWGATGASAQPAGSVALTLGATTYNVLYK
jgi:hypothetical protein